MTTYILEVEGMTCPLCTTSVRRAIRRIKGVKSVSADLRSRLVVIESSGQLDAEAMFEAIEAAGRPLHTFKATLIDVKS
jgi:copper chaperone CopZ